MNLVTAEEMREMDRRTIEFGISGRVLMENAGRGATQFFLEAFAPRPGQRVGVMAGRGNNGGDGFVMARYLKQMDLDVTVYLLTERRQVQGDARVYLDLLGPLGVPIIEIRDTAGLKDRTTEIRHQHFLIDAILGTGLISEVRTFFRQVIDFINKLNKPVFSVDIPSGLDSETGQPRGTCVIAKATATFALAKTGHVLYPGAHCTGQLKVVDIGIPPRIVDAVGPRQRLLTPEKITPLFSRRQPDAHKGTTGHLLVVAGSPGKSGAGAMTAMSAMRVGAGLVTLAVPRTLNPVLEAQVTEVMTWPLPETADGALDDSALDMITALLAGKACLALGPGIGTSDETRDLVLKVLGKSPVPVVVDADGLNCLGRDPGFLKDLDVPVILTPHPGEMARLTGKSTGEIQSDRVGSAREFATTFGVHLVLKGARTVIAHPDGSICINPTGNSGMASGGMGDVLTGVIAGLVSQGFSPDTAAQAGVHLHGLAADAAAEEIGPFGYLATDVINRLPIQIRRLTEPADPPHRSWPVASVPGLSPVPDRSNDR